LPRRDVVIRAEGAAGEMQFQELVGILKSAVEAQR
jgi:hypothetical protein